MSGRPTWEQVWTDVANAIAGRAQCENKQVGAVIVDPSNRIVSTGYNGPPAGLHRAGPCRNWCARQKNSAEPYGLACPTVHAEANALLWADRRQLEGGRMYVTAVPCADCAKLIANSGLSSLWIDSTVYDGSLPDRYAEITQFLQDAGLKTYEQRRPS